MSTTKNNAHLHQHIEKVIIASQLGRLSVREITEALEKKGFPFKVKNHVNAVGAYLYGEGRAHFTRTEGRFHLASPSVPAVSAIPAVSDGPVKPALSKSDLALTATKVLASHQLARNCAAQSVLYAAKCGGLLNDAKESLGHGEFGKWLKKNCPGISPRSCNHYMALASGLQARLDDKFPKIGQLSALELPDPRDLKASDNNKLALAVKKITDGKTLSQLYLDFNIVKKGGKAEAAKEKVSRTGNEQIDGASNAKAYVDLVAEKLANVSLFDKHMADDDRTRFVDSLMTALRSIGIPVTIQKAA